MEDGPNMVGEGTAGSSTRNEFDLVELVHARAKNAIWRSWSLLRLSEVTEDEPESVVAGNRRRPTLKASPEACEVVCERFLENMSKSRIAVELSRRLHGDPDISSGGMMAEGWRTTADDAVTATATAPLEMSGRDGGPDSSVGGGQLFGYLADRGAAGGASAGAGRSGTRPGEPYDQCERRGQPRGSAGEHRESPTAAPIPHDDPANTHIKPSLSDPILGVGIDDAPTAEHVKLLRKAFTQARNQRHRDVADETVSAFLGDDLSVHYKNHFGSLWGGGRSCMASSGASSDASGGGGGAFETVGPGGAGGGSHVRFVDGGQHWQHQQHQRHRRRGEARQPNTRVGDGSLRGTPFGRSRGMVSLGDLRRAGATVSATPAAPASAAVSTRSAKQPGRQGTPGGLAALRSRPLSEIEDSETLGAGGAVTAAASATRHLPSAAVEVASGINESSALPGAGMTPLYQLAATDEEIIVGSLPPTPPGGGRGRGVRSASALDHLDCEQDREKAVMMPLIKWNEWNPDRLHWTFPAVVKAFPRCLYDVAGAGVRRRGKGKKRSTTRRSAAAEPVGNGVMPETERDVEAGNRESSGGGESSGVDGRSGVREEQQRQQRSRRDGGVEAEDEEEDKEEEMDERAGALGEGSTPPPDSSNPFEPYSLGEVHIRTAPSSDLALAGVGAGPWRRRWLVLRQTYVFELLHPPPASVPKLFLESESQRAALPVPLPLSKPLGAAVLAPAPVAGSILGGGHRGESGVSRDGGGRGGEEGQAEAGGGDGGKGGLRNFRNTVRGEGRAFGGSRSREPPGDEPVTPTGFLCLSKASVENGGKVWGPKTLLLRCQSHPSTMSREEISAASSAVFGGGAASARAGRAGKEIRVELRVPSEETGQRWAELFRERAALEMSTLFEPSPNDLEEYTAGVGMDSGDANDSNPGFGRELMADAEAEMETEPDFSVLGTGQYSKVVCAKRKQPWARAGRNVCAIKIVDKKAFWSRVRNGKERVDSLAREVFCQTMLTIKGADGDRDFDVPDAAAHADDEDQSDSDEAKEGSSKGRSFRRPSGDEAVAADGTGGGGIVRVHSIMETADDLILEMDLMSRTDLFDRLLKLNGAFSERQAAGMARNLLLAIDKCNRLGFCHRDVKPANLLYPGPGSSLDPECVVLADFGMATMADWDGLVRGRRCGTVGYVAPEILRAGKHEGYGVNVDIFSAGAVLYVCLCGYEPFFGTTDEEIKAANKEASLAFELGWEEVSDAAKDLISKMMEPEPLRRITPREALQHPWIVKHHQQVRG